MAQSKSSKKAAPANQATKPAAVKPVKTASKKK